MAKFDVLHFVPINTPTPTKPIRSIEPSLQKSRLVSTTFLCPKKNSESTLNVDLSLNKHFSRIKGKSALNARFEFTLDSHIMGVHDLHVVVSVSRRVELSFSLIQDGRYVSPPSNDAWKELINLFPTTYQVNIRPPILIIHVRNLPPTPWPSKVAGMALCLTTSETGTHFDIGIHSKGPKALQQYKLQKEYITKAILDEVATFYIEELKVDIVEVVWIGFRWIIIVSDDTDIGPLPWMVAGQACGYKFASNALQKETVALPATRAQGATFDDSSYDQDPIAPLRPGVMLSSKSGIEDQPGSWYSSTSGVLVTDNKGRLFITVSSQSFPADSKVYHPTPMGRHIGDIDSEILHTGIALAKLAPGTRYTNEIFGTDEDPLVMITQTNKMPLKECRIGDDVWMDNPFSGRCEGTIIGISTRVEGIPKNFTLVRQVWILFENGKRELIRGSCGSAILNEDDQVVSFFSYLSNDGLAIGVAAQELHERGYEIIGDVRSF